MPDVAILAKDQAECFQLQSLFEGKGIRVKFTFETKTILEWLKLRSFELACIDSRYSFNEQQEVASFLWEKDPQASLVVYNLQPQGKIDEKQIRLFGAELAYGEKALPHIERILERRLKQKSLSKNKFKVLVVDDLDSPRDIICSVIESLGFSAVSGVSSVKEALFEVESNPNSYQCIVTDIRMPGKNGQELIKNLRAQKDTKDIPVIVLTAHGSSECLIDCLKAGASGFLVKPPKKVDLNRELSRAMRIVSFGETARLVPENEVEQLRAALAERGLF